MSIELSEAAAARIREVVTEKGDYRGLRFGLKDGGCSGYAYLLEFERAPESEDLVFERDGAKVYVHPMHLPFLEGSVIRFDDTAFQSGFSIDNPNVKRACGCGESFDV